MIINSHIANALPWLELSGATRGAVLYVDEVAAESLKWCGGLRFAFEVLGCTGIHPFAATSSGGFAGIDLVSETNSHSRAVFIATGYLWDLEASILDAVVASGSDEVLVLCTVSPQTHACHPLAKALAEQIHNGSSDSSFHDGELDFDVFGRQLETNVNSRSQGRRNHVSITIAYLPLHALFPLQTPQNVVAVPAGGFSGSDQSGRKNSPSVAWFVLLDGCSAGSGPGTAFPLRHSYLPPAAGTILSLSPPQDEEGAGDTLFLPNHKTAPLRSLAHSLAACLSRQLCLDTRVGAPPFPDETSSTGLAEKFSSWSSSSSSSSPSSGRESGQSVFALGTTSALVGSLLAAHLDSTGGGGGGGHNDKGISSAEWRQWLHRSTQPQGPTTESAAAPAQVQTEGGKNQATHAGGSESSGGVWGEGPRTRTGTRTGNISSSGKQGGADQFDSRFDSRRASPCGVVLVDRTLLLMGTSTGALDSSAPAPSSDECSSISSKRRRGGGGGGGSEDSTRGSERGSGSPVAHHGAVALERIFHALPQRRRHASPLSTTAAAASTNRPAPRSPSVAFDVALRMPNATSSFSFDDDENEVLSAALDPFGASSSSSSNYLSAGKLLAGLAAIRSNNKSFNSGDGNGNPLSATLLPPPSLCHFFDRRAGALAEHALFALPPSSTPSSPSPSPDHHDCDRSSGGETSSSSSSIDVAGAEIVKCLRGELDGEEGEGAPLHKKKGRSVGPELLAHMKALLLAHQRRVIRPAANSTGGTESNPADNRFDNEDEDEFADDEFILGRTSDGGALLAACLANTPKEPARPGPAAAAEAAAEAETGSEFGSGPPVGPLCGVLSVAGCLLEALERTSPKLCPGRSSFEALCSVEAWQVEQAIAAAAAAAATAAIRRAGAVGSDADAEDGDADDSVTEDVSNRNRALARRLFLDLARVLSSKRGDKASKSGGSGGGSGAGGHALLPPFDLSLCDGILLLLHASTLVPWQAIHVYDADNDDDEGGGKDDDCNDAENNGDDNGFKKLRKQMQSMLAAKVNALLVDCDDENDDDAVEAELASWCGPWVPLRCAQALGAATRARAVTKQKKNRTKNADAATDAAGEEGGEDKAWVCEIKRDLSQALDACLRRLSGVSQCHDLLAPPPPPPGSPQAPSRQACGGGVVGRAVLRAMRRTQAPAAAAAAASITRNSDDEGNAAKTRGPCCKEEELEAVRPGVVESLADVAARLLLPPRAEDEYLTEPFPTQDIGGDDDDDDDDDEDGRGGDADTDVSQEVVHDDDADGGGGDDDADSDNQEPDLLPAPPPPFLPLKHVGRRGKPRSLPRHPPHRRQRKQMNANNNNNNSPDGPFSDLSPPMPPPSGSSAFGGFGLLSKGLNLIAGASKIAVAKLADAAAAANLGSSDSDDDDHDDVSGGGGVVMPWECPAVVLFVVGGVTATEVAAVRERVELLHSRREASNREDQAWNAQLRAKVRLASKKLKEAQQANQRLVAERKATAAAATETVAAATAAAFPGDVDGSRSSSSSSRKSHGRPVYGNDDSDDGSEESGSNEDRDDETSSSGSRPAPQSLSSVPKEEAEEKDNRETEKVVKRASRRLCALRKQFRPIKKAIPHLVLGGTSLSSPEHLLAQVCL